MFQSALLSCVNWHMLVVCSAALQVGLLNEKGQNLALQLKGSAAGSRVLSTEDSQTAQLLLNNKTATFTFSNVQQQPVLSVLRGFSAPVKPWVDPQTPEDLALIAKYDRDVFSRQVTYVCWGATSQVLKLYQCTFAYSTCCATLSQCLLMTIGKE